jgi:hypothetical protein
MRGAENPPAVLYVAGHSQGDDHLSRQVAIALQSVVDVSPFILTTADIAAIPSGSGIAVEYFPRPERLGKASDEEWDELFRQRLTALMFQVEPHAVVVDDDRLAHIAVTVVSGRTPTIRIVAGSRQSPTGPIFDHVIESAELGSPTVPSADRHHVVKPILSVESADMMSGAAARKALGLPVHLPAVLVNIGDSADSPVMRRISGVLRQQDRDVEMFVTRETSKMSRSAVPRYLHAFDAVISNAAYHDFHEIVASGTPAVFFPDPSRPDDGQAQRGKLATGMDVGAYVDDVWSPEFEFAVRDVLDPAVARRMRTASVHAQPGSGTTDAARIIAGLALRPHRSALSDEFVQRVQAL